MTSKINNVSDVFREAKTRLWDGIEGNRFVGGYWQEVYICYAIDIVTKYTVPKLGKRAKNIVMKRLNKSDTVFSYLVDEIGVPIDFLYHNREMIQKFRRDWLSALEEEFKPKLKPKKGYYIYHIDGDLSNNELDNLAYVPNRCANNFK